MMAGELLGPPAGGGDFTHISSQCDKGDVIEHLGSFSASCKIQSWGKTSSPAAECDSPSYAELGTAEAKTKQGGAFDGNASHSLSLQTGAEFTLS